MRTGFNFPSRGFAKPAKPFGIGSRLRVHLVHEVNGLRDAAESMWRRAKSIKGKDGNPLIGWPSPSQSPTVWVARFSVQLMVFVSNRSWIVWLP